VEIFQVSADYLLGTDEVVPLLKSSSAKLSSSSMPHTPAIGVPLVGFVHAGLPMLADENITEYIPVSANEVSSGECFFMQVEGDCMMKRKKVLPNLISAAERLHPCREDNPR